MSKNQDTPAKFNPYASFAFNEDTEKTGFWVDEAFFSVKVARAGGRNTQYSKVNEAVMKPFQRLIAAKKLPDSKLIELQAEVYAKTIVKGWRIPAAFDSNGVPVMNEKNEVVWKEGFMHDPETFDEVEASVENIIRLLTFKDAKGRAIGEEIFDGIFKVATSPGFYRDTEGEEEAVKN